MGRCSCLSQHYLHSNESKQTLGYIREAERSWGQQGAVTQSLSCLVFCQVRGTHGQKPAEIWQQWLSYLPGWVALSPEVFLQLCHSLLSSGKLQHADLPQASECGVLQALFSPLSPCVIPHLHVESTRVLMLTHGLYTRI